MCFVFLLETSVRSIIHTGIFGDVDKRAMDIDISNVETELTALLQNFAERFALKEMASITIRRDQETGTDFRIEPNDSVNARFWVNYLNNTSWINLYLAENTFMEIPLEGNQYTDKEGVEELFCILEALVTTVTEEQIWRCDNNEIAKSIFTLDIKDEATPVVVRCYNLHNPFLRTVKSVVKYLPYQVGDEEIPGDKPNEKTLVL